MLRVIHLAMGVFLLPPIMAAAVFLPKSNPMCIATWRSV